MVSGRRSKRARRRLSNAEADTKGDSAERPRFSALSAGFVVDSLEKLAAVVTEDPATLLPILDARAVVRMDGFSKQTELLPPFAWRAGYAMAAADHVLENLGAPWYRADRGQTEHELWLAELRSGLDTFARICWCLRFGHSLAAVALTRWYIERWTYNVAFSFEVARLHGEDDANYIDRVWAQYPESMQDVDVAANWSTLSELLHGRSVRLDSTDVRIDLDLSTYERAKLHNFIVRTAEVPLRQIRGCISVLADEQHVATDARAFLQARVKLFPNPPNPPDFLSVFSRPVDLDYVSSEDAQTIIPWGNTYREMVRRGTNEPLRLTGFQSWMSIEERWVRFTDEARTAFEIEAKQVGDAFDPTILRGRLLQYRSITEMTVRASADIGVPKRAEALSLAAAALESAWVLWLQDVDESLVAIRCVLESTARVSATVQCDALTTGENEATQTDWVGDLSGRLGVDPAARGGRGSAASGGEAVGDWAVDGREGVGV